jgi:hypothetical protein
MIKKLECRVVNSQELIIKVFIEKLEIFWHGDSNLFLRLFDESFDLLKKTNGKKRKRTGINFMTLRIGRKLSGKNLYPKILGKLPSINVYSRMDIFA